MIPHNELSAFVWGCRANSEGDHMTKMVDSLLLASLEYRRIRVVPDGDSRLVFSFEEECVRLDLPLATTRIRSLIARMAHVLSLHVRKGTKLFGDSVDAIIPMSNGSVVAVRVTYSNQGGDYYLTIDRASDSPPAMTR